MAQAMAASFDCNRARSKLNRVICSDAALSRLDETVWNTYGERIRSLSALQYAHVRERHLLWRRSRGLYETTVEALTHEYTSHLAWLTHPLLGLEGRYERGGHGSSAASIEIEVDARAPSALDARGLATTPMAVAWRAQAQHDPLPDSSSALAVRGQGIRLHMRPRLLGHLPPLTESCEFDIVFSADEAKLTSSGECGAHFGGSYARTLRD
jgi:hypothetical protein